MFDTGGMLTPENRALLAFEEAYPRHTGQKADLILYKFEMPASRYYQRLRWLATQRDAVEAFPQVCSRVSRRMERKREQREALLELL